MHIAIPLKCILLCMLHNVNMYTPHIVVSTMQDNDRSDTENERSTYLSGSRIIKCGTIATRNFAHRVSRN